MITLDTLNAIVVSEDLLRFGKSNYVWRCGYHIVFHFQVHYYLFIHGTSTDVRIKLMAFICYALHMCVSVCDD